MIHQIIDHDLLTKRLPKPGIPAKIAESKPINVLAPADILRPGASAVRILSAKDVVAAG